MAKTKSKAAKVHPYPQMATAKGYQCVILLQGAENSEVIIFLPQSPSFLIDKISSPYLPGVVGRLMAA